MNKPISVKELAKLIKICKNMGVSSLKYGEIELSLDAPDKPSCTPTTQARGSNRKAQAVTEIAGLQAQHNLAQEIVETLHVEDPAAYEAMLIRGEFGEEKNH